jgi:hypothetical protein
MSDGRSVEPEQPDQVLRPGQPECLRPPSSKSWRVTIYRIEADGSQQLIEVEAPEHAHTHVVIVAIFAAIICVLIVWGGGVEKHVPAIIGLALIAVAVVLTFTFPNATPLQRQIILTVAALGGGATAAEIPGFLNINLSLGEKAGVGAGGALAVFFVLYWYSAAKPPD